MCAWPKVLWLSVLKILFLEEIGFFEIYWLNYIMNNTLKHCRVRLDLFCTIDLTNNPKTNKVVPTVWLAPASTGSTTTFGAEEP